VAEAARQPVAAVMHAEAGKHAPTAVVRLAATRRPTIQAARAPLRVMQQRHMQLLHIVAAADIPAVVAVDMPVAAADVSNL